MLVADPIRSIHLMSVRLLKKWTICWSIDLTDINPMNGCHMNVSLILFLTINIISINKSLPYPSLFVFKDKQGWDKTCTCSTFFSIMLNKKGLSVQLKVRRNILNSTIESEFELNSYVYRHRTTKAIRHRQRPFRVSATLNPWRDFSEHYCLFSLSLV